LLHGKVGNISEYINVVDGKDLQAYILSWVYTVDIPEAC
jgi:hypothetical protein